MAFLFKRFSYCISLYIRSGRAAVRQRDGPASVHSTSGKKRLSFHRGKFPCKFERDMMWYSFTPTTLKPMPCWLPVGQTLFVPGGLIITILLRKQSQCMTFVNISELNAYVYLPSVSFVIA